MISTAGLTASGARSNPGERIWGGRLGRAAAVIRMNVNVCVMRRSLTALEHSGVEEKFSFQLLSSG